jgi:hypothetical protein
VQHTETFDEFVELRQTLLLRRRADALARVAFGEARSGSGLDAKLIEQ